MPGIYQAYTRHIPEIGVPDAWDHDDESLMMTPSRTPRPVRQPRQGRGVVRLNLKGSLRLAGSESASAAGPLPVAGSDRDSETQAPSLRVKRESCPTVPGQ